MKMITGKWIKNEKGLTLIELLAVVVVLGIIALIAVPAIQGTITSQKEKADVQTQNVIQEAAQRYVYDVAPEGIGSSDALPAGILGSGGSYTVQVSTLGEKGYLNDKEYTSQVKPDVKYVSVQAEFDQTTGWTIGDVNAGVANP